MSLLNVIYKLIYNNLYKQSRRDVNVTEAGDNMCSMKAVS